MSTVSSFYFTAKCILRALCELTRYTLRFGWVMVLPKARLAARAMAAESQLAIELNRSGGRKRRPQFTPALAPPSLSSSHILTSNLDSFLGSRARGSE